MDSKRSETGCTKPETSAYLPVLSHTQPYRTQPFIPCTLPSTTMSRTAMLQVQGGSPPPITFDERYKSSKAVVEQPPFVRAPTPSYTARIYQCNRTSERTLPTKSRYRNCGPVSFWKSNTYFSSLSLYSCKSKQESSQRCSTCRPLCDVLGEG